MDKSKLLALFEQDPGRTLPLPEVLALAGVGEDDAKTARRMLKALVREGRLERERGRRYRLSRAGQERRGRIAQGEREELCFLPEGEEKAPLALAPGGGERLEAGDVVLARLAPASKRGKLEARVLEVLERPKQRRLAVFRRLGHAAFVELSGAPAFHRAARVTEIPVPQDSAAGAQDGQLVEVEIERTGRGARTTALARVLAVLGRPGEREAEMRRLMLEHHLSTRFPPEVEREVAPLGDVPSGEDLVGRVSVRELPLVTIDGETAKDFDDAVAAVKRGDGFTLYVAIADVAHYVRPKTALDEEALRRGTSTYLTDRAIPMLPEALSSALCSLVPHKDRLCFVVELDLDGSGHVDSARFYRAVMRSHARLTYTRVARALEGEPDEECGRLLPTLLLLNKIASLLLARRLRRGAIDLDLPEPVIEFDAEGLPTHVSRRPRSDAHRLIEELMLAANEAVASFFVERELPSVFRVHQDPDADKLESFTTLLAKLGLPVKLKKHPRPADIARLLEELSAHPLGRTFHGLLLRSMMQARYDPECKGHFGLAAERYLHFTSPIRRYPDLMVHRLLARALAGQAPGYSFKELQEIANLCSEAERRAMLAERESMDLDRAYVALEHLGEALKARVTSVQGFGLFATVEEPFLEGLIPVTALPQQYWQLDEHGAALIGAETGQAFTLGQELEVEIAAVNLARRQVELALPLAEGEERAPRRPPAPRAGPRDDGRRPPRGRAAPRKKNKARGGAKDRKKHPPKRGKRRR